MSQSMNLGNHTAELDEQTGVLTLHGTGQSMRFSAHETYNLLVWLSDNHRDTLSTLAQSQQGQLSSQRLGIDAKDLSERAHEDWSNDE